MTASSQHDRVQPGSPVVEQLIGRARSAQRQFEQWNQERVDEVVVTTLLPSHLPVIFMGEVVPPGPGMSIGS